MRIVVGITGASGAIYALRLLEVLSQHHEVILIVSENGAKVLEHETGVKASDLMQKASFCYANTDLSAPPASGSYKFNACVIVPCSMNTLSKLAFGISDNLLTRVGMVCLKERRKLVLVPRETPLSRVHIEAMLRLSDSGAVILPAMPAFYGKPKGINELVDFIVGKILDVLGIENELYVRWG